MSHTIIILSLCYAASAGYVVGVINATDGGLDGALEHVVGAIFGLCWPVLLVVYVVKILRKRFARVRT